jgi:cytochrome c-type biogenesis protein CcmH
MIGVWIGAALLSALAAVLIVFRSARASAATAEVAEDPSLAVYRRQLTEIDDLAERGLLPEGEQGSARAEAARRLLTAADQPAPAPPSRPGQWLVAAAATAAPLIAAGLYLWLGSPGTPDQPFAKRLVEWSKQDAATLQPAQMVALLTGAIPNHRDDPTLYYYLARAQAQAGDPFSAERSLHKAIALAPGRADLWSALGAFLVGQSQGEPSADALAAFAKAQSFDPNDVDALYYLSRAKIGAGDVAGGLAGWTTLLSELKPDDPRKAIMAAQIAQVQKTHALPVDQPQQPAAQGADTSQQALINGMVAKLAAQLGAAPDDPAGWARLIHSYGVLGDKARQDAALAKARNLFKNRPADLHTVEAALEPAQ